MGEACPLALACGLGLDPRFAPLPWCLSQAMAGLQLKAALAKNRLAAATIAELSKIIPVCRCIRFVMLRLGVAGGGRRRARVAGWREVRISTFSGRRACAGRGSRDNVA